MAFQSVDFLISPDELEKALSPFTLFISNTHVPKGYTHTPTGEFISDYTRFYDKLCSGERIDSKADYEILGHFSVTTDISSVRYGREHIYNGSSHLLYEGSDRGFAPYLAPFALWVYTENGKLCASTRGSYMLSYADIMGFQMSFPKLNSREAAEYGITSEKDWASYKDYTLFRERIMDITSPFTFSLGGIKKKTSVRVSGEAIKSMPDFSFIKQKGIVIC